MSGENRAESGNDVTETEDLMRNLDARADKIAKIYSLSFPATVFLILCAAIIISMIYGFTFVEVITIFLPFLLFVCLFFVLTAKTFNPFGLYEAFYKRERERAYARFLNQGERAVAAPAPAPKILKKCSSFTGTTS